MREDPETHVERWAQELTSLSLTVTITVVGPTEYLCLFDQENNELFRIARQYARTRNTFRCHIPPFLRDSCATVDLRKILLLWLSGMEPEHLDWLLREEDLGGVVGTIRTSLPTVERLQQNPDIASLRAEYQRQLQQLVFSIDDIKVLRLLNRQERAKRA